MFARRAQKFWQGVCPRIKPDTYPQSVSPAKARQCSEGSGLPSDPTKIRHCERLVPRKKLRPEHGIVSVLQNDSVWDLFRLELVDLPVKFPDVGYIGIHATLGWKKPDANGTRLVGERDRRAEKDQQDSAHAL